MIPPGSSHTLLGVEAEAYLDLAARGKNAAWRYALGVAMILAFWIFIGGLPMILVQLYLMLRGRPLSVDPSTGGLVGLSPLLHYLLLNATFLGLLAGIYLTMQWAHRRPLLTLITPAARFDLRRFAQGFALWFALDGAISLVEALLYPGRYAFTLDLARFLPAVPIVLLLTPLQTTAEELFFRGYLLQGFGRLTRNPWLLMLLSGLFFALPHFANRETSSGFYLVMSFYFAFGAFMAWLALRDGRLELALGVHAGNNVFGALVANYTQSSLTTPSIFTSHTIDPVYNLVSWLVAAVIFGLIAFRLGAPSPETVESGGSSQSPT